MGQELENRLYKTGVLVIGGGLTGLRAALAAAEAGETVTIVWKGKGASPGIMGFNVPVGPEDSVEIFIEDTMQSGMNINSKKLVRILAEEAEPTLRDLENRGMMFAKDDSGYHLLQPLGCSYPRLVHYNSSTGIEIGKLLLKDIEQKKVIIVRHTMMTDLLVHEGKIVGACGINMKEGKFVGFYAKAVILTTGGCGTLYPVTTYPSDIACDGYGMAYRAGAEFVDMEFIQFEPCCFVTPEPMKGHPIPTTTLMAGGQLRNGHGEDILARHGLKADTRLQKDILSRAMRKELQEGRGTEHGGLLLDISMLPHDMIVVNHAIFYNPALKAGVDLTKDPAEVAPAAHTSIGGIKINENCKTSIEGLYAAGEVVGGIHGANRIGGHAGTETVVFGAIAGTSAAEYALSFQLDKTDDAFKDLFRGKEKEYEHRRTEKTAAIYPLTIKQHIQQIMQRQAGIIRNEASLTSALAEFRKIENQFSGLSVANGKESLEIYVIENMTAAAQLIIIAALTRIESRGVHYRDDYPETDDAAWVKNNILKRSEDGIQITTVGAS